MSYQVIRSSQVQMVKYQNWNKMKLSQDKEYSAGILVLNASRILP